MTLEDISQVVAAVSDRAIPIPATSFISGLTEDDVASRKDGQWKLRAASPRREISLPSFRVLPGPVTRLEYACASLLLVLEGWPETELRPLGWDSIFDGIVDSAAHGLPIFGVSWEQAFSCVEAFGATLPTEFQWECLYHRWNSSASEGHAPPKELERLRLEQDGRADRYGRHASPHFTLVDADHATLQSGGITIYPGLLEEYCQDYFDFDLYRQDSAAPEGNDPLKMVEAPPSSRSLRGFETRLPAIRWYEAPQRQSRTAVFRCVWPDGAAPA